MPNHGKGGAPRGNQNAHKAKLFHDALKRALARAGGSVDGGLNKVCDRLVQAALDGEPWAFPLIAERVEGKVAQAVQISGDEDQPLRLVTGITLRGFKAANGDDGDEDGADSGTG